MNQNISQEQQDRIIGALNARGVALPCPRCGNSKFTIVNNYSMLTLQSEFSGLVIGGPTIPVAITACERCGFIAQHALGVLGLLPPQGQKQ